MTDEELDEAISEAEGYVEFADCSLSIGPDAQFYCLFCDTKEEAQVLLEAARWVAEQNKGRG